MAVVGPGGAVPAWAWVALGGCVALAVVAVTGRGKGPFVAAIAIAAVDVRCWCSADRTVTLATRPRTLRSVAAGYPAYTGGPPPSS